MRYDVNAIIFVLVCIVCQPAAGITLTSTKALASTNAFAPLDKSAYYDEHIVENVSPAIVNAAGDWTGTNFGGSVDTWHWIGNATVDLSTQATADQLAIKSQGSISYDMSTTPQFISPSQSALLYDPGCGASSNVYFRVDTASSYNLTCDLGRAASLSIYSVTNNAAVFSTFNSSSTTTLVSKAGLLPPGEYSVGVGVSSGGVASVGASHTVRSGSFTNFNFTVSVPEPSLLGALGFGALLLRRQR